MGVGPLLTLLLLCAESPPTNAEVAERAAHAFEDGCQQRVEGANGKQQFEQAAALYEQLCQRGIVNPTLYRNLGNAQVLADDLPHALLSYHRGLRLAPQDAELRRYLAAARELVHYPAGAPLGHPATETLWQRWSALASVHYLISAAVIAYTCLCLALTRWFMTRNTRLFVVAFVCLSAAIFSTFILAEAERRRVVVAERALVIISDDGVLLRKGDGLTYPPRYETPLNRGVEARLLHEKPEWVQLQLAGGEIGWVPRKFVLLDRDGAD